MAPRRFRVSRFSLIMHDPTRSIEFIVGLCNVVVPGIPLALGASEIPAVVIHMLSNAHFSDQFIGVAAVLFGLAQIWGSGTDWYSARALIATAIGCLLVSLVAAYWWTGFDYRPTPWLMAGTAVAEMFLAWRCWHEKPVPVELGGRYRVPI